MSGTLQVGLVSEYFCMALIRSVAYLASIACRARCDADEGGSRLAGPLSTIHSARRKILGGR